MRSERSAYWAATFQEWAESPLLSCSKVLLHYLHHVWFVSFQNISSILVGHIECRVRAWDHLRCWEISSLHSMRLRITPSTCDVSLHHLNAERIRTWMKVQNHSISHQHSKESSRARRGQSYTRPAAYTSLVVHVRSGEKGEAVGETRDWLRGNGVRGRCEWERKEASVLEVVRGVDGNSSLYMVMVGLLMFNVHWVQFEIESIMNYE